MLYRKDYFYFSNPLESIALAISPVMITVFSSNGSYCIMLDYKCRKVTVVTFTTFFCVFA